MNETHELATAFVAILSDEEIDDFASNVLPSMPKWLVPLAWRSLTEGRAGRVVWHKGTSSDRAGDAVIETVQTSLATALRNHPLQLDRYSQSFRKSSMFAEPMVSPRDEIRGSDQERAIEEDAARRSTRTERSERGLREQMLAQYGRALQFVAVQVARADQLQLSDVPLLIPMWREVARWGTAQTMSDLAPAAHQRAELSLRLEQVHSGIDRLQVTFRRPESFAEAVDLIAEDLGVLSDEMHQQLLAGTSPMPLRHLSLIYALRFLELQRNDEKPLRQGPALARCLVVLAFSWLTLRRAIE